MALRSLLGSILVIEGVEVTSRLHTCYWRRWGHFPASYLIFWGRWGHLPAPYLLFQSSYISKSYHYMIINKSLNAKFENESRRDGDASPCCRCDRHTWQNRGVSVWVREEVCFREDPSLIKKTTCSEIINWTNVKKVSKKLNQIFT